MNPTATRYHPVSIALHWLLALMILGSLSVGLYMTGLAISPTRLKLYNWHKWAGMTILILSALRLLWRLGHAPPPDLPMPAGWAYSSSAGFPVVLYGVLPLPDWVAPNRELSDSLKLLHRALAYALAAAVGLHVAAALRHHFIDRDGLLRRMQPGRD